MSKYVFIHKEEQGSENYPSDTEIKVEFSGDCDIIMILEALKCFLKACTFPESLVERIRYDDER